MGRLRNQPAVRRRLGDQGHVAQRQGDVPSVHLPHPVQLLHGMEGRSGLVSYKDVTWHASPNSARSRCRAPTAGVLYLYSSRVFFDDSGDALPLRHHAGHVGVADQDGRWPGGGNDGRV